MLILQICDFMDDGDGCYRMHDPSRYLSRLPGVTVIDCHFYHRLLPSLIRLADIIVLPFVHNEDFFPIIDQRRAAGQATVFEANDYFYDVQPWNTVGPAWQDRAIQEEYREYMTVADGVQTSTEELARRWQPWARQVAVFPNQLTEIPPLVPSPVRPLTIGWGGSPGHFADWYALVPWLQPWLDAHPEIHLAVMTHEFAKPFLRVPPERYHFTPFGSLANYLRFLPELDIGLAPLLPSDYNRCRSDVKYLEYAAHGVVGIYADLEPYRGIVVPGETGFMYKTPEELHHHLDRLVADVSLRQRVRQEAHAYVARERRLSDHIGQRLAFYQSLARGTDDVAELPKEVYAAAVVDGRYLQLRPQQPEKTVQACAQGPAQAEGTRALAQLIQQYPNYEVALQHQGKLLNDLRESSAAVTYLEHALRLNPHSARTQCEMGRARFLMGDVAGARKSLEDALTLNPYFQAGWHYLLRLLSIYPEPNGRRWADKAIEIHPRNFNLALAGIRMAGREDVVVLLEKWLTTYAAEITRDERASAVSAYSLALGEMWGKFPDANGWVRLLERSCRLFSESARLADLHWRALSRENRWPEAYAEQARALDIRRQAQTYQLEFPKEDGTIHFWQFGEHILKKC